MAFAKPLPSYERLHSLFRLDQEAGALFWKRRPRSDFGTDGDFRRWNTKYAGKRADRMYSGGYFRVRVTVDGRCEIFQAHRVIWKMVNGRDPFPEVDHIDRDEGNNRPSNLREATRQENACNRRVVVRRVVVGRGALQCVYPTSSGKYRAQINRNGRCRHLGVFASIEEAKRAVASVSSEASS